MRLTVRARVFSVGFSLLAALALGGNIYIGTTEESLRADLSMLRDLQQQSISMRGNMAYLLATNEERFLKVINTSTLLADDIFKRLEKAPSLQSQENARALKNASAEFQISQEHLTELNQDFNEHNAFRQLRSSQLLLSNYQLLITDLQELESTLNVSWAEILQLARYIAYLSFAVLFLAAVLMNLVIGKWVTRPFSEGVQRISQAMKVISEKIDLNESEARSQHLQVNQTAVLLDSLNTSTDVSNKNAVKNLDLSSNATLLTTNGMHSASRILQTITELKEKMNVMLKNIELTREQSANIRRIAESVKNQSQEITLLSLNAGILAVNAGEYGYGFKVIADEVGKLAVLSKALSDEANSKTIEIENSSFAASVSSAEGELLLLQADQLSIQINNHFDELVRIIQTVNLNSHDVTVDAAQQSVALKGLSQVSQVTLDSSQKVLQGASEARANLSKINESVKNLQKLL